MGPPKSSKYQPVLLEVNSDTFWHNLLSRPTLRSLRGVPVLKKKPVDIDVVLMFELEKLSK